MFFQTLKRFLTSFSILFNFQGPVRLSLAADDLFILPPKWFFVKPYFLEAFELSELGHPRSFSEQTGTFQRLLVLFKGFLLRLWKSFFCLSAWRSHIVPYSRGFGKSFCKVFCHFLFFVCNSQFFSINDLSFGYISAFFLFIYRKLPAAHTAGSSSLNSFLLVLPAAESARRLLPTWAAFRSNQWASGPARYSRYLPGRSTP